MLEIDGAYGEGGGQLVRTAVALAAVTGRAVRIVDIRAGRAKPGLAAQHVAAVRAVAEICGASVQGADLQSREISFTPGAPRGGSYAFDVGTAGSVALVLQALLPVALATRSECSITVTGGTEVRGAPPADYLRHVLLPLLARAGVRAWLEVRRRGYYPRGGGELLCKVSASDLRPIQLVEPGPVSRIRGRAHVANLPLSIAERMCGAAAAALSGGKFEAVVEKDAFGQGGALVLWAETERSVLGAARVAERGVRAEILGETAARELAQDLAAVVALDAHAADQILVYLALAGGESSFTTRVISSHTRTAMWLIERFLPARFEVAGNLVRVRA